MKRSSVHIRISAALTTLLMACPALADDTMILKEGWWLRMRPSENGKGVRINRTSQPVTVQERGNGWALVKIENRRYWVHSDALQEQNDAVDTGPKAGQTFQPTGSGVAIRNKPGTKGTTVLYRVSQAHSLQYMSSGTDADGDTWYKVKYSENGRERQGYIFEGLVKPASDSTTEAGTTCASGDCSTPGNRPAQDAREIAAVAAGDAKGYSLGGSFANACSKFINRNGLGEWGRYMVAAAKKIAPNCFYNRNVFNSVCPNYRNLNESQKNAFIGLLFAAIAQVESTCRPWAQAPGVTDIADGLFQLEYSASQRRAAGRNERWCRTGQPTDTQSLQFQSECAVSIVEDTVCSWGAMINSPEGYWQKLRHNRKITQLVRNTAVRWGICR